MGSFKTNTTTTNLLHLLSMADLLGKLDPATAGLCLATAIFGAAVGYVYSSRTSANCCNTTIKKDCPKVVDTVDIEDLAKGKTCYCRCWQSKKFPLCDGSHNKHNAMTCDNLGPLVITKE